MTPVAKGVERDLTPGNVAERLWESAIEALVSAFIAWVLGGIAVSIVGGIWGRMIPSPPPFLTDHSGVGPHSSATFHHWWHSVRGHGFALLFTLFFVHAAWTRLWAPAGGQDSGVAARVREILRHISKHWFGLVVGNAFGAWISAMILVWVQRFSLSQFLWHTILAPVLDAIHGIATFLLGPSRMDTVDGTISWYGQNKLKFTFWFLYMAAICDDLGLPNVKTLGRWLWGRVKSGSKPAANAEVPTGKGEFRIEEAESRISPPEQQQPGIAHRD